MSLNKHIKSIDGIRGFAAIYVLLGHIILLFKPYQFFPNFEFLIKLIFGYGHQAVLLFFIVSGFSIHYNSKEKFKSINEVLQFYYKRFRRIYPIFFICLLISLLILFVTKESIDLKRILLSFTFLTDISAGSFSDPIQTNFPIWSLSYEMIYYLIYPLLIFIQNKQSLKTLFIICLFTSFLSLVLISFGFRNHFTNVFSYLWIWVSGLLIAHMKKNNLSIKLNLLPFIMLATFSFMFVFEKNEIIKDYFWTLFFITIFFLNFISEFRNTLKYKLINFSLITFSISIGLILVKYENIAIHREIVEYILVFILLIQLFTFNLIKNILSILNKILKIFSVFSSSSYAIYLLHWPIFICTIYLFKENYMNNLFTMLSFILISTTITLSFSWFLENKFQLYISKKLDALLLNK